MPYADLRDFIADLDTAGELIRIRAEVDTELEIACITDLVGKLPGDKNKALLFERVKGSSMPVLTNALGSARRINMMAGTRDYAAMTAKLTDFLEILQEPRKTLMDKLAVLPLLRDVSRCFPKYVRHAPCHDVILQGDAVDLTRLPVLTTWPEDGGPFITLPLVFTKDPIDGKRNCGMYRLQIYDRRTTGFHVHTHHTGADHLRKAKAAGKDRLEVAVAIGAEPEVTFSAVTPLPPGLDEMLFAGFLKGSPVRMVKCKTVDLEVPASAEIVIEGYVPVDERRREGPFGDHTGFYSLADDYHVFHVTAITMRRDPIYQATLVGPPPMEDHHITDAIERLFLPLMRQPLPEVEDYRLPHEGVAHNLMLARIKKDYPGQGRKVGHAIWGLGQAMFTKVICIADRGGPDVNDYGQWVKRLARDIDASRDIELVLGPTETLDHASRALHFGSKMALDLTRVMPGEPERAPAPTAQNSPSDPEMLAALQARVPAVRTLSTPFKGEWRHVTLVTLDKSPDGAGMSPVAAAEEGVRDTSMLTNASARDAIRALWELYPNLPCAQRVLVFDAGEPLDDARRVIWLALSHIDPERDLCFDWIPAGPEGFHQPRRHPRRIGIDCTTKSRADGCSRAWPLEQRFPEAVLARVRARWMELELPR